MALLTSTTELVTLIAENVKTLNAQLETNGSTNGTKMNGPSAEMLLDAKSKTLQAIHDLELLIKGPLEIIMAQAHSDFVPLHVIHEFEVAKAVPLEKGSQVTYQDVAASTGLSERDLRRVMRSVMLNHIFTEPQPGYIAHTPASRLLAEDVQVQSWVNFYSNHILPSKTKVVEMMRTYPERTPSTPSAFALAHDNQNLYAYLKSNPSFGKIFQHGLNAHHRTGGTETSHLIRNIPDDLRKPEFKWVDVGGGDGSTVRDIALVYPELRYVSQDLAHVVESPVKLPPEIQDRVSISAHDFFTEQPVVDADVYLLRNVLFNWQDGDCVRVLKRIADAMKPSARIVINDIILPDRNEVSYSTERKLRAMDLDMFTFFNNRARDRKEWMDLFSACSPGLKVERTITPKCANHSLIILALDDV